LSTANIGPLAPFCYTCASDTWSWSDEAYRIFGFSPAEVVPTTDLILRHLHPDDVDSAVDLGRRQLAQREGFCLWLRVVDAQRRLRQVLAIGEGVYDGAGECTEVRGSFLDVSRALRMSYAQDVDEAVRAAARTRGAIEQAKGVLMLAHRVTAEEAFEILRRCSQATNVKVRDLARSVMTAAVETGQLPGAVRSHLQAVAGSVGHRRTIPASLAGGADGSLDGALDGTYDGSPDGAHDGPDGSAGGDRPGSDGHSADDAVR
jgi:hypothetical protein